jgi:hypothetical protein
MARDMNFFIDWYKLYSKNCLTGNPKGFSIQKSSGVINLEEEENKEKVEEKKEEVKEEVGGAPGAKSNKLPLILVVLAVILVGAYLLGRVVTRKAGDFLAGRVLSGVTGGNVKVDESGGKVTFENSEGKVSFEGGDKLPEGFPADFPLYPGAKIVSSFTANTDGKDGMSVAWETGDSVEAVSSFYKSNLVANGWKVSATFEQGDSTTTSFEKEGWGGFMGITSTEGKTTISATVGVK